MNENVSSTETSISYSIKNSEKKMLILIVNRFVYYQLQPFFQLRIFYIEL